MATFGQDVSRKHNSQRPTTIDVKIAAISLATIDGLVAANYERALRLTDVAALDRPDVIVLPEAFAAGYCADDLAPFGETLAESKPLQAFQKKSAEHDCLIVLGYLQREDDGTRNAVVIFDRGKVLGVHYKSSLWADERRPWRDERQLQPGAGLNVFPTRFGRLAIMTCYENMLPRNWRLLAGKTDWVISPYNCEDDPARHNLRGSAEIRVPSAWADRTGMFFTGDERFAPNPGTAGIADASGKPIAKSPVGVEQIVCGTMTVEPRPVERGIAIGGALLNADGSPSPETKVAIYRGENLDAPPVATITTDAQGELIVDALMPGTYTLVATNDRSKRSTSKIIIPSGFTLAAVNLGNVTLTCP